MKDKFPRGQFVRYVVVGGWNTLFGYGLFVLLTYVLTDKIPYAYMAAAVIGNVINITMAYAGYKLFVFKTKGNYLREYLRFYVVYGAAAGIGLVLLPILVAALKFILANDFYAPYIAGAILTLGTVLFSFVGHKRFSFRTQGPGAAPS